MQQISLGGSFEWETTVYFCPLFVHFKTLLTTLTNSAMCQKKPTCGIFLKRGLFTATFIVLGTPLAADSLELGLIWRDWQWCFKWTKVRAGWKRAIWVVQSTAGGGGGNICLPHQTQHHHHRQHQNMFPYTQTLMIWILAKNKDFLQLFDLRALNRVCHMLYLCVCVFVY